MKLISTVFVTSAAAGGGTDGIPRDGRPQIAVAGRSNVGKSTLLNALCRTKVARTSAAPGKTRLANVFRITAEGGPGGPGRWDAYLVDLPGYGYARGGADSAAELAAVAEAYFRAAGAGRSRTGGRSRGSDDVHHGPLTLLLVDSRHPGLDADRAAAHWLDSFGVERLVVATKVDKLSRGERVRNLRTIEATFGTAALPVSAVSGEGLDALWKVIARKARDVA